MFSIGMDVHQNSTALCILDSNGRVKSEREVKGGFKVVAQTLSEMRESLGEPFRVCYEASCGYGTLYDLLTPIAQEVKVAHATELKLIFRSKHKNDRNDAKKIAKLLYMDDVPAVHVPTIEVRAWRGLIEHRRRLVDKRTAVKNALRAQLRGLGIKAAARQALWSKKGIVWLKAQEMPTTLDTLKRTSMLAELEMLDTQIASVTKELDAIAEKNANVTLLRTMPGVGTRTAEAVAAYIDDPKRFHRISSIGKYFGIVPTQDESAGKNRLGHITRQGPATVRKLITQAAWIAVRGSPRLRAFFERVKGGQKGRTGIALTATAHKMLRIMLAMLRSKEAWRKEEKAAMPAETPTKTPTKTQAEEAAPTAPVTADALPASASANGTETQRPRRRGRGKGLTGLKAEVKMNA